MTSLDSGSRERIAYVLVCDLLPLSTKYGGLFQKFCAEPPLTLVNYWIGILIILRTDGGGGGDFIYPDLSHSDMQATTTITIRV